ncbi:hypothetical protein ABT063_31390 [Streptomyces sp. NPDC002838]|uniref:hypothetical protein n=1 Tax=Streptomyces sp. NPDC002838 TaxID=3154436 RepID=UPI0033170787
MIQRLKALDLPAEDFAVHGSGPMLVAGLRSGIGDLDVVARGRAWEKATEIGDMGRSKIKGNPVAKFWGGRIEVFSTWVTDGDDVSAMIDEAITVDGVRFVRLEQVLRYKQLLRRAKDLPDIHAIEAYLREYGGAA